MKKTLIQISSLLGVLALSLLALTLSGVSAPTRAAADTDATVVEVQVHAIDQAFAPNTLNAPANTGFTIHFYNDDTFDNTHDIRVRSGKDTIAKTDACDGPCELFLQVPALAPGVYNFICTTHDDMGGTLNVG